MYVYICCFIIPCVLQHIVSINPVPPDGSSGGIEDLLSIFEQVPEYQVLLHVQVGLVNGGVEVDVERDVHQLDQQQFL